MDTDTCDWTARHIVHLQLPLVIYSKTHTKNIIIIIIIIIIIMQRLTRHVSVIRLTNRRRNISNVDKVMPY